LVRRALLISLSLVLALAGGTAVSADDGFYVISGVKQKYAPAPKTGQTTSYGTRDDGALHKGVPASTPRFTDNGNGTVTDNLSGLIWTKNANAFGQRTWDQALSDANSLASSAAGLTDGSQAGDWRLPNLRELQSLADYGRHNPAVPEGHPFTGMQSDYYWSSTTHIESTNCAWFVYFSDGRPTWDDKSAPENIKYVWCVRGGA
jgi:hypothetical protein